MALCVLVGVAQENQGLNLHFDQSKISPQFTMPELPATISPTTNIKPTFNATIPTAADLKMDYHNQWADSLAFYHQDWNNHRLTDPPRFHYDTKGLKASDLGHSHIGSLGNLCNDKIAELMEE